MKLFVLSAASILTLAGAALAQPVFTQLPAANSIQIIATDVSEDGETVCGFVSGHQSFIWRRSGSPQIEIVMGQGSNSSSGPYSAVVGMDDTGTRFLFPYRDPEIATSPVYTGGLVNCSIYENYEFNTIAPPAIAQGCDQSMNTPTALSRDGNTVMAMAWNRCAVAPFSWNAGTGWTAWATQDSFPPFGQVGYQSHKVVAVSRDGSRGAGWFQSGVGYGGRTALVWTNNGATVSRLDVEPHDVLWGEAGAISSNGRFVVGSMVPPTLLPESEQQDANRYLYRWTVEGGVEILPGKVNTSPGSIRHPNANAVSDDGRFIIGQDAFGGDRDAFVWTPETGAMTLVDYVASKGLNLSDQFIRLTSAVGMSSNGRFITGQWMDLGGSIGPFVLDMGEPAVPHCGAADVGSAGGESGHDDQLDNNDFIVFINLFFAHDALADMGVAGGGFGHDGLFDNNDFIAFINHFFQGCAN